MSRVMTRAFAGLIASAAAIAVVAATPAAALDDPPKIDCSKPANKNKPACKPHAGPMSDDEIYNAAYWMAHHGAYREALRLLDHVANADDPRVLSARGYATRKLGNVEAALPLYARALEIDPSYTRAREYLGEALLSKDDLAGARDQLQEIAMRCGTTCSGYAELEHEIAAHATHRARPAGAHTAGG